jgi:hypothetical protein
MAFHTISVAPGLTSAARKRARDSGPPAVDVRRRVGQLLASAGFVDIEERDVTSAYRTTQQAWFDQWEKRGDELRGLLSAELVAERQDERRRTLEAIDAGLLERSLFTARR